MAISSDLAGVFQIILAQQEAEARKERDQQQTALTLLSMDMRKDLTERGYEIEAGKSMYNENMKIYRDAKKSLDSLQTEYHKAVGDIYQEQLGLLGEQKGLTLGAAQSQFAGGQRDVSMGTQVAMRNIQTGADTATSRAGLATSGTIEQQTKIHTGDLVAKYKNDMTKLVDTRSLSRTEADLSYRKGEMSAEDAYQNTLTGIESEPPGFLEGMFS